MKKNSVSHPVGLKGPDVWPLQTSSLIKFPFFTEMFVIVLTKCGRFRDLKILC